MKPTKISRKHFFKGFSIIIIITLFSSALSIAVYPIIAANFNILKPEFSLSNINIEGILGEPKAKEHFNNYDSKEVINILLAGVDQLQDDDEFYPRADMMAIVSIDKNNNKIKVSSLLRDSYVDIEGHGSDKLNQAFVLGGPELLMDSILSNFGIRLDQYVYIDFGAFIDVIDLIGGVDIELNQSESYIVLGENSAGEYLLDGTEALNYSRIRKIDNDFNRTSRQRNVMQAVFNKLKDLSVVDYLRLVYTVYPRVTTNLSFEEVSQLASIYFSLDDVSMTGMYFPADGTFEETEIDGQDVVDFNKDKNRLILYDFIYHDESQEQEW